MAHRSIGSGTRFEPSRREVEDLLRRAGEHPLGHGFLRHGALDAVAATFQVHAFTVDAARRRLASDPVTAPPR